MIDLTQSRTAQAAWADMLIADRLAVMNAFRRLVGQRAAWLASQVKTRPLADTLAAEVLPLAEAALFLHRRAKRILAGRRAGGMAPVWLPGVSAQIRRVPLGVVLIVAPRNYPLFLPGVQALQALTAGNAVAVKPAPGCSAAMEAVAELLLQAKLPAGLLRILPESSGPEAVAAGFDHIVFTGSVATGRDVLLAAAERLTPCTMELSGCDAAFVLPGADIGLVARSLAYGLRLNGGATCIAPRRVFVTRRDAPVLEAALKAAVKDIAPTLLPPELFERTRALLASAEKSGARVFGGLAEPCPPLLIFDADADMELLKADLFAPWLAVVPVDNAETMLHADAACPYALGASIWGPSRDACRFARRVRALSICINDLIAPTADPRLPFGGRGRSGFGTTRGAEGLLAMTLPQAISRRAMPLRPHLMSPAHMTPRILSMMAKGLHAAWWRVFTSPFGADREP